MIGCLGLYEGCALEFTFTRDLMYFLVQSYIPAIIIVVLSWVSFWIIPDRGRATVAEVATSRAYIGVTGVLSMILVMNTSKTVLPNVDNLNAVDVYFFVSFVYVLAALVEFITVHFLNKQKRKWLERRQRMKFVQKSIVISPDSSSEDEFQLQETSLTNRTHTRLSTTSSNATRRSMSLGGSQRHRYPNILSPENCTPYQTGKRTPNPGVKFMPPQYRPGRHPISNWRDNASPQRCPPQLVSPRGSSGVGVSGGGRGGTGGGGGGGENSLLVPSSGIELQLKPVHFDHNTYYTVVYSILVSPENQ